MNSEVTQPRRHFLKTFSLSTVMSAVGGRTLVNRVLADLEDGYTTGVLTVRLSDFPVLNNGNGSIRINFAPVAGYAQPGRFYPVILTRGGTVTTPTNTFFPLRGECTHQQCILSWYNSPFNANSIFCACHNSRFSRSGVRLSGDAPVGVNLTAYPYTFDGTAVRIQIPNLYHKVDIAPVASTGGERLRLNFAASRNGRHKILYRPTINGAWVERAFSLTPSGPADRNTYIYENYVGGSPDTQAASVYVDQVGDTGFFAVDLQTEVEP